jgi:hypothetical protein
VADTKSLPINVLYAPSSVPSDAEPPGKIDRRV